MKKVGLVVLLLIALGAPIGVWTNVLESVRDGYDVECPEVTAAEQVQGDRSIGRDSMKEQNALLLNWAFVALAGTIALITTTGTHPFKWIQWLFLLLAPALSLLVGSLWAGLLFERRATFLEVNQCAATGTLNDLLLAQSNLLAYAVLFLGSFALLCLTQIVVGVVNPGEEKT